MNAALTPSYFLQNAALCAAVLAAFGLAGCASGPKLPDWQLEAKGAMERSVAAYLEGNPRVEAAEFARAKAYISRTGQVELMAKIELLHCASHVASLDLTPCDGFEKLRQDAPPELRAYADHLTGQPTSKNDPLLPTIQLGAGVITTSSAPKSISNASNAANAANASNASNVKDPLSQLLAVAVLFQSANASPAAVQTAVDVASTQGWRRPLLAWLGVQLALAEKGGDTLTAERLKRRIELTRGDAKPAATLASTPAIAITPAKAAP